MDDFTPPSPLLKAGAFVARWFLALMLFAWFLFAAAWGTLHLVIVPRIGELRPQLEAVASRVLGVTVRVQAVSAYSTGMIPSFELSEVSLIDRQGREALRLPRILVSLSPRSLLALKFDQLYVDSPRLEVRRTADGKVQVAGFSVSEAHDGRDNDRLTEQLFAQPELVIRHGLVLWTDELRDNAPLELRDVDVVLRNHGRRHDLRVDATPPVPWGSRFGLVARFEQPLLSMDAGRWQEWSGQAFVHFDRVDVSQLHRHADLGIDLQRGYGALRAWVDIRRGEISGASADVALADVALRLDPALDALRLKSVSGRVSADFEKGAREFSTRGLAFETADGMHWPGGNLRVRQVRAGPNRPAHGELEADKLDLAALTQVASRVPLGAPVHAALERYGLQGTVAQIKASWQGAPDALQKYEAHGRVERLHVRPQPGPASLRPDAPVALGVPGIAGATVNFDLDETGGNARLDMHDGSITFPGVFEEPLVPFRRLAAKLAWRSEAGRTQLQLSDLRFSNADADGELQLKWQTSDPAKASNHSRFPGTLDLQGSLSRAEPARVYRYLPLLLHAKVRNYVRDAVKAGSGSGVKFKVKGDLHDMPFANPKLGEFSITADLRDVVFAYVPRRSEDPQARTWPELTGMTGTLAFDRKSLQVKATRAGMAGAPGVQFTRLQGGLADMLQPHASVSVVAEGRGPLADMLGSVNASPLAPLLGDPLARAAGTGAAELRLKLAVPLDLPEKTTVQGTLALAGSDFQLSPDMPRLARIRGTLGFSESGFSLNNVQARVWGGNVRLDGNLVAGAGADGGRLPVTLALRAQGTASADGLRQAPELGIAAQLAQHASGSAAYSASFAWRAGVPEVALSSNLVGMSLDLPAPVRKSAESSMPLRMETTLVRKPESAATPARKDLQDQLRVELGHVGAVNYLRDLSGPQPRVLRGTIGIGLAADESVPLPTTGVAANIRLDQVDIDAWRALISATASAQDGKAGDEDDLALRGYLPDTMAMRAGALTVGGHVLRNLVVGGSRVDRTWRGNLEADELSGYVEYRQPADSGAGRVYARLARLTLAPSSASDVESLLDQQPTSIPALDIVVDALELRGKHLGKVEVEAINEAAARGGGSRDWLLRKFDVTVPEASLRASGNWTRTGASSSASARSEREPTRRTTMNFRLDIGNSGEFLKRLGMPDAVRRGKGAMQGQVSWTGSPLSLDYASLAGGFAINIENGQFLKADPGLAKLLGVLSLQSLPRRLALDFRDVFSEGFAFDFLRGDVKIDHGIAASNNLQMKGVNAAVLMDGTADLSRETQDLRVVVVPEINAGTASLIATAINPAIGLGSFLAQLFLRRPLMEAATQEFHIDGSWADPRIQRVARRSALAAGDESAEDAPARQSHDLAR